MTRRAAGLPNTNALDAATARRIVRRLRQSLPVDDLLAWLTEAFPQANRDQIFSALSAIYEADFRISPANEKPRRYEIGTEVLSACPQRVEAE